VNRLALLVFVLSQVAIVLIGLAVLRAARTRPRTIAAALSVLIVAGLAGVWFGSEAIANDPESWPGWYRGGLALVVLGCPALLLVPIACAPNEAGVGPRGAKEWAQAAFGYLVACWLIVLALGVLAFLTATPSGQFR
jgi:hypothetical protein